MNDIEVSYAAAPATPRPARAGGSNTGLVALSVLAAGLVAVAIIGAGSAQTLLLALLAAMAAIGVFCLLSTAVGLVSISGSERWVQPSSLTDAVAGALPEGLAVTNASGDLVFVNSAYCALLDLPREEAPRAPEQAFASNPFAADAMFRLVRAAGAQTSREEEIRLPVDGRTRRLGADPGSRWLRIAVGPIKGQPGHVLWRLADVTHERQRQEEAFQRLQEAVQYLDQSPAGFFATSVDGRIQYMNATLAQWLGRDLAAMCPGAVQLSDLFAADSAALLQAATDERKPATVEFDLDLVRIDGTSLPVHLVHRVLVGAGSTVQTQTLVLASVARDPEAHDSRWAEARFARFFHAAPMAIATLDKAGRITNSNAAFSRLFHKRGPARDPGGRLTALAEVLAGEGRSAFKTALDLASAGRVDIAPVDVMLEGEGERSARLYVSPVAGQTGPRDPDAAVAIVYVLDTTELRVLESRIHQGHKLQAIGALAGGVAHDFNNLLTAIIGNADLALLHHKPTDQAFQEIMQIKTSANRGASLVRQLLAYARKQRLVPKVLQLNDVIGDINQFVARMLGDKIEARMNLARDLWSVKADATQIEQVLINLAVNARDAMPHGGSLFLRTANISERQSVALEGGMMDPGQYVMVEVSDTGTGIPPEIMDKIFEPFFTTKDVGRGTGLGLSMVYGIIKQTGGYIFPESTLGKGTSFRIYLPRHVPTKEEEQARLTHERKEKAKDLTGSERVLLVEDEDAVRMFASRGLKKAGYQVIEAASGVEALAVMETEGARIDLVVSDVMMPEMDGPTLAKHLRAKRPDLKIIFTSGYAEDALMSSFGEHESFVFLPKPFSLKQLGAAVKDTLRA